MEAYTEPNLPCITASELLEIPEAKNQVEKGIGPRKRIGKESLLHEVVKIQKSRRKGHGKMERERENNKGGERRHGEQQRFTMFTSS